jgi:hypothetical protein
MANETAARGAEAKMDATSLYREEIYTDRAAGTIRVLVPVTRDGGPDQTRPTIYVGEAQILTNMGPLPVSFEIEARTLGEAVQKYADAAKVRARGTRAAGNAAAGVLVDPGAGCGVRARRGASPRRREDQAAVVPFQLGVIRRHPLARDSWKGTRPAKARFLERPLGFRETLAQKVSERAHLRGQVPPARVHDVNIRRRQLEAAQDRHQPTRTHFGTHLEIGLDNDAQPCDRHRCEQAATVGVDRAGHADAVFAALSVAERPDVPERCVFVGQARVRCEVLGLRGLAAALEIRGRCATDQPCLAHLASDEILAADAADTHRDIETLLDQIDRAIRQLDVEAHFRMTFDKANDRRGEMAHAEGRGACEPQRAAA